MFFRDTLGLAGLLGEGALALGLLTGCGQTPYQAFAVEVAATPPSALANGLQPTGAAPPQLRAASGAAAGGLAATAMRARHPQWDLNRVPAATLQQLPGIDAVTVQAILAGRPYKDKRQLLRRKILSAAQYAQWKDYLVVHRGTTKASD